MNYLICYYIIASIQELVVYSLQNLLYIHQQGEEKRGPQSSYKKRVDDTTCKVCIKTFYSNAHFVMMKSLLEITIKNVNIILNNVV